MSRFQMWLAKPAVLWAFGLGAAVLAAVGEQVLAMAFGKGWSWLAFLQDLVRNGLIATVVAVGTSVIQRYQRALEQRREHNRVILLRGGLFALAANGWSALPTDPEPPEVDDQTLTTLEDSARTCRALADRLDKLASNTGETNDQRMAALPELTDLDRSLAVYQAEGGRNRRLIYMGQLSAALEPLESSSDPDLAGTARRFRAQVTQLAGWIQHTDTTIVENLLISRATPFRRTAFDATHALFDLYEMAMPDAAVTHDPVYLLCAHTRAVAGPLSRQPDQDMALVPLLLKQVSWCLGALRNELRIAAACLDTLRALAERAIEDKVHIGG